MTLKIEPTTIDLGNHGGPVYTGRPNGEALRSIYLLDKVDAEIEKMVITNIPENTFSVNSSFFLGLFGQSVRASGSREAFLKKFEFICPEHINEYVESGIERALQERVVLIKK